MSYDLPKAYDFKSTEQRLYKWWEEKGFFQPSNDPNKPGFDPAKKPFVISIPPANVTGELHLGHAIFVAMEDLMIRYHRMMGEPTLWVPGTDHAGIATQLQVEKALAKEGIKRDQTRTRGICSPYLGVEGKIRRYHHQPDPPPGRVLRLDARAVHLG